MNLKKCVKPHCRITSCESRLHTAQTLLLYYYFSFRLGSPLILARSDFSIEGDCSIPSVLVCCAYFFASSSAVIRQTLVFNSNFLLRMQYLTTPWSMTPYMDPFEDTTNAHLYPIWPIASLDKMDMFETSHLFPRISSHLLVTPVRWIFLSALCKLPCQLSFYKSKSCGWYAS